MLLKFKKTALGHNIFKVKIGLHSVQVIYFALRNGCETWCDLKFHPLMELLEGDMIFFFFLFSACSAYEVSYLKTNLLKFLRNLRKPNLSVCKQRGLSMLLSLWHLGAWEGQSCSKQDLVLTMAKPTSHSCFVVS